MGFFSYLTADTKRSIPAMYSNRSQFTMHVWLPEEEEPKVFHSYDGYGRFDEQDFHELVARVNGLSEEHAPPDADPQEWLVTKGISYYCRALDGRGDKGWVFPQITETNERPPPAQFSKPPDPCPDQGYFYADAGLEIFA